MEMERGESVEKLKSLHITSLDDDETLIQSNRNGKGEAALYVDDDEDDEDEEELVPVVLGFLEKPKNKWSLLRQLFPSKAGGTPAWLDPINLPNGKSCLCDFCCEPLQFVLQVYAPLSEKESGKESTFHRTLLIFMCTSMACLLQDQHEQWKKYPEKARRSVKVFRCQLPKINSFYSSESPKYDGTDKPLTAGAALCSWCGTWKGDKICGSCRRARYCSERHQATHWKSSHRSECQQWTITQETAESSSTVTSADQRKVVSKNLWPEYEIINEDESEYDTEMSDENENANSLVCGGEVDEGVKSMMDSFEGDADRKSWASFQEQISRAPEQVLRYCRDPNAKPLWPISSGRPSKNDVPKCSYCGGSRGFEFQVLPQLLYYFGVKNDEEDSLDWATIVVYTCEASCEGRIAYKEEFPWVQLASQSTTSLR